MVLVVLVVLAVMVLTAPILFFRQSLLPLVVAGALTLGMLAKVVVRAVARGMAILATTLQEQVPQGKVTGVDILAMQVMIIMKVAVAVVALALLVRTVYQPLAVVMAVTVLLPLSLGHLSTALVAAGAH